MVIKIGGLFMKKRGVKKRKQDSIRAKIMSRMSTTVLVGTMIIGIFGVVLNFTSTIRLLQKTMAETVEIAAERVEQELYAYSNIVYEIGTMVQLSDDQISLEQKKALIEERAEVYGFQRGNILDINGNGILDGNNYSDREYYQAAMKGEKFISEPLVSKVTGEFTVIIAAPIWENGIPESRVVGVVYFVPVATFLNDIVTSIQISEGAEAYMLNGSGTIIAHPNMENVINEKNSIEEAKTDSSLNGLAKLEKKMLSGENGFGSYFYKAQTKVLAYASIMGTNNWSIGITAPITDFLGTTFLSIFVSVGVIGVTLLISGKVTRDLAHGIGEPLMICAENFQKLSEGDLHTPMTKNLFEDEIGQLMKAAATLKSDLTDVIGDIKYILGEFSKGNFAVESRNPEYYKGDYAEIIDAIRQLRNIMSQTLYYIDESAEQVSAGSIQLSQNAQGLAEIATEQAHEVETLTTIIANINEISEKNAIEAESAYHRLREAEHIADKSQENLLALTNAMSVIQETSLKIQDIITSIEDIASQTNLLSLNASIEAARAGEAGRGFAVVANQIGKLATDSARSAVDTKNLINKSMEDIQQGSKITHKTVEAIKAVLVSMSEFQEVAKQTSETSREQADMLAQIQQSVEQISASVENNSSSAEETSATSEELSAQAELLKEQVEKFKLRK